MGQETIVMWYVLVGATNSIFGIIRPDPEMAFKAGQMMGEAMKKYGNMRIKDIPSPPETEILSGRILDL